VEDSLAPGQDATMNGIIHRCIALKNDKTRQPEHEHLPIYGINTVFFFFCLGEHCVYAMLSLAYSFATISIEKQAVLPVGTHQLACHLKGPIVCEKDIYCTCTCNHIKWHVY